MENPQNELKYCFTVFADILGYSQMIKDCNNDYDQLSKKLAEIKDALIEPQYFLSEICPNFDGRCVKIFSDSVFVNVPLRSELPTKIQDGRPEIGYSLEDLANYQFELALKGYFIRGCATVNYAYFDETTVFGTGVLEVVECEKKAKYPRICLTDNLISLIRFYCDNRWPGYENISYYVFQDSENKYFLNYLQAVNDYISNECCSIPDDVIEYPLYINVPDSVDRMIKHKEKIENSIEESSSESVLNKFIWLAKYHNFFCRKHFDGCDFLIIEGYDQDFHLFVESD